MITNDISGDITDGILFYLLTDLKFLSQCRVKVEPNIFKSPIAQIICQKVYSFFDSYQTIIGIDADKIIIPEFPEKEQDLVTKYLYKIFSGNYVKDYIYDKLDKFLSKRAWETALVSCVELLDRDDTDSIEKIVYDVLKNKIGKSIDFKNVLECDLKDFYTSEEKGNICTPTGIKDLDSIIGGFKYKELSIIVAPLNVGKSWMLVFSGSRALLYGKDVLHITLEMSKNRVLGRYLQRFAGVTEQDKGEIDIWSGKERIKYRPDTINNVAKIKKAVLNMGSFGGKLYIEEFPDKTLTIKKLESLLNDMELENGKVPDLIFVDGLQGLKYDENKKGDDWKSLENLCHQLRKISFERNVAMVTTTHSQRAAIGNKLVQSKDVRGSIDILNIADLGLSLNQSNEEFALEQARLFIMRSRTSKKWKQVRIYQNLNMGHFCVYSEFVDI